VNSDNQPKKTTDAPCGSPATAQARITLEDAVHLLPHLVWIKDAQGTYLAVNASFAAACNRTPEEIVGLNDFDLWTPEFAKKYLADDKAVFDTGIPKSVEEPIQTSGMSLQWFETYKTPIRNASGQVVAVSGIARNISDKRIREQEYLKAREAAEASRKAKSSFLSAMSHDLRAPMNAIIGYSDLLTTADISPEAKHHADIISASGSLLLDLLNTILDYSKIEAGNFQLANEIFLPANALREAAHTIEAKAVQKSLSFSLQFHPTLSSLSVRGDGARLRQIAVNLLDSALKHTEQGTITLAAETLPVSGEEILLQVSITDTGKTIPPERIAKLLSPNTSMDTTSASYIGSSGLSISLCHLLADAMSGSLKHSPCLPTGNTYTLQLPMRLPKQTPHSLATEPPPSDPALFAAKHPMRLLVVDDTPLNLRITLTMLKKLGYDPSSADSAESAYQAISTGTCDLVLMDVNMPYVSGLEATQKIRAGICGADKSNLYIIALTAYALSEDRETCLSAGMNDHLPKPMKTAQLIETLRKAYAQLAQPPP